MHLAKLVRLLYSIPNAMYLSWIAYPEPLLAGYSVTDMLRRLQWEVVQCVRMKTTPEYSTYMTQSTTSTNDSQRALRFWYFQPHRTTVVAWVLSRSSVEEVKSTS